MTANDMRDVIAGTQAQLLLLGVQPGRFGLPTPIWEPGASRLQSAERIKALKDGEHLSIVFFGERGGVLQHWVIGLGQRAVFDSLIEPSNHPTGAWQATSIELHSCKPDGSFNWCTMLDEIRLVKTTTWRYGRTRS